MCTPLPSQPAAPLHQYAQVSQQGMQKYVLDGPTSAPARYDTPLPHAALLQGLRGTPEWDDAWCVRQMRPSHSPPSRVLPPTSIASPPLSEMEERPMPRAHPQGTLHVLQLKWHETGAHRLFLPATLALLDVPGNKYSLQE